MIRVRRNDPLVVVEILGVDKNLEWPALLELRTFVEDDVVDRDVHRVIRDWRFHLIRRTDQHIRTLELLVHPNNFSFLSVERLLQPLSLLGDSRSFSRVNETRCSSTIF